MRRGLTLNLLPFSSIPIYLPIFQDKGEGEAGPSGATAETVTGEDPVKENQIALAVEVLTSKACSEEGLEDVTALLLNLSYGGSATRETILRLLLAGARELGNVVSAHVSAMLKELRGLKEAGVLGQGGQGGTGGKEGDEEEGKGQKGVLSDRFTREAVVPTAPAKMKGGGAAGNCSCPPWWR